MAVLNSRNPDTRIGLSNHCESAKFIRRTTLMLLGAVFFSCSVGRVSRVVAQDMPDPTIERVKHATVMVWTFASKRQKADTGLGSGSGYFINSTGLFITNNHVIDPGHGKSRAERQKFQYNTNRLTYKIITDSGTQDEKIWECELLHQSLTADQALLQAHDNDGNKLSTPNYLRLLPAWRLAKRMKVSAFGFPGGNTQRATRNSNARVSHSSGVVTGVPRAPSGRIRRIETNVIARPGNSGGPMVDSAGYVVGTITLLTQEEDQANACALVPSTLTRSFIRDAVRRERIPNGSDFAPLFEILAGAGGQVRIPEFKRLPDRDALFMEDNERVYGTIDDETITWTSPLGRFEIPPDAIAYIIRDKKVPQLVLEGGNHILGREGNATFQFSSSDGKSKETSFDDVVVVGFRSEGRQLRRARGKVTVIDSDVGRLALVDVEGKAKFVGRNHTSEFALEDIVQIEPEVGGDRQVVTLTDGRRLTGRFQDTKYRATIAATGTPVEIELDRVSRARVETVDGGAYSGGGLTLLGALSTADAELLAFARILEAGDPIAARTKLEPWLDRGRLAKMAAVPKSQVRLLDGVIALRAGDTDAMSKIRKCIKSKDPNIGAYARGCVEVLKAYGKGYEGEPLSDPDVFADAGAALGEELIRKAKDTLKDRRVLEGKKGEYHKYMNKVKKHEKAMQAAAVFSGPDADDVLIELWKFALELGEREYARLSDDYQKMRQGRRRVPISAFHELEKLRKKAAKVADTWKKHYIDLTKYGFYYSESLELEEFE